MSRKTLRLLDVTIDNLTKAQALDQATSFLHTQTFHHIVTVGPEFLLEASAHPAFCNILNRADLSLAEGMGIHIGAGMTGQKLRQRIPGVDFVLDLMSIAAKEQKKVFLFGGQPEHIVERAAEQLVHEYPGLSVVGIEAGARGSWTKLQDQRIVERIHMAQPDILLVAMGAPKQELWIDKHRAALHNVSIAIGVGRTFEYLAGTIKRAPKFVRSAGFEWLHTYLTAAKYYQPQFRRRRVTNATYRFVIELMNYSRTPRV